MSPAKKITRTILTSFTRMAPVNSPAFIYKYALSAPPLRTFANKVLLSLLPESITLPEGTLSLDQTDPVISGAITFGVFEVYETEIFRTYVKPGMTVVDIGANIGYYTLLAAKGVGTEGRIYAFEPERASHELLKKNMCANECTNVSLFTTAISDKESEAILHISKANKGNHSIINLPNRSQEFTTSANITTNTLDNICLSEKITNIDLIKIDVEGAEGLVLAGMQKTLALPKITLFLEFFPENLRQAGNDPAQILAMLTSHGFVISNMNSQKRILEPVNNHAAFIRSLSKRSYTNLLCVKNPKTYISE